MDDHADAEAPWQAPYGGPVGLYLRYVDARPPIVLGIYDSPDDTPGVSSVLIPEGWATRGARDVTRFLERIDDVVPGLSNFFPQPFRRPR